MNQKDYPQSSTKRNLILTVGIIGFIATYMLVKIMFPTPIEKKFQEFTAEINKKCPMVIDEYTRLDSVVTPPNSRIIKYYYRLSGIDEHTMDIDKVNQNFREVLIDNLQKAPDLKLMRDNDVSFVYIYSTKDTEKLIEINVIPSDYK